MFLPFTGIVPVIQPGGKEKGPILKDHRMVYDGSDPPGTESKFWTRGGYLDRIAGTHRKRGAPRPIEERGASQESAHRVTFCRLGVSGCLHSVSLSGGAKLTAQTLRISRFCSQVRVAKVFEETNLCAASKRGWTPSELDMLVGYQPHPVAPMCIDRTELFSSG